MELNALNAFRRNLFQSNSPFKLQPTVQPRTESNRQAQNPFALTERILNQNLSQFGTNQQTAFNEPQQTAFNPQEVAKNVLGFVRSRLQQEQAQGADSERLRELLAQAQAGVEQGIEEASAFLQDSGLFTDDVEQGIQQARDLILNGLNPDQDDDAPVTSLIEASQSFQQIERQSFELAVRTQDGDAVTIRFSQEDQQSSEFRFQQDANGQSFQSQQSFLSSSQLSFSVEGDLDKDELKAINALIRDVNKTASTFYAGDVQAAFNKGLELGFNTEEIAGFALQLNRNVSSVTTTRYREVQELNTPQLPGAAQLGQVLDQLRDVVNNATQLLANSRPAITNLFQSLLARQPEADTFRDLLTQNDELFNNLAQSLIGQIDQEED